MKKGVIWWCIWNCLVLRQAVADGWLRSEVVEFVLQLWFILFYYLFYLELVLYSSFVHYRIYKRVMGKSYRVWLGVVPVDVDSWQSFRVIDARKNGWDRVGPTLLFRGRVVFSTLFFIFLDFLRWNLKWLLIFPER